MRKLKSAFLALGVVAVLTANAQSTNLNNVLNFKSTKNSGPILENDKLVGYFVYYFKEKNDKKTSTYEIALYDDNYNLKKNFELVRPRNSQLMETVFNGKCFLFKFYDKKTGLEFVSIDKGGNQLGSMVLPPKTIATFELNQMQMNAQNQIDASTMFPLGKTGFVRQTFTKYKKTGYELVAYDNKLQHLWTISSPEDSKLLEFLEVGNITEDYITATVLRKKNAMTKSMDGTCIVVDLKKGKIAFELPLGSDEKGKLSLLKSVYNPAKSTFSLVGEYYKPGDDILKDRSQGIYVQKVDANGIEMSMKKFSWKKEIAKFNMENMDEEDKKDNGKGYTLYFHDAIISSNGHITLVGEQFRKQMSALGVAGNVLAASSGGSSNAAAVEVRVGNMAIVELDEHDELVKFDLIQKRKTSVMLPAGAGFWSTAFLGFYIKSTGGFDYRFTSNNVEKDKFTVVYTDYDRKEEGSKSKADLMLGVINVDQGQTSNKRVAINSSSKVFWVAEAKPGHISVGEYFQKEKTLSFRLEKLEI